MAGKYRLLSADSHLEFSPDRWTDRVPAQHRDRAPRRVKLTDGGDAVIVENTPLYVLGLAITGKPPEEHLLSGVSYDDGPGGGSPERRIREQEQDGVDGEIMYSQAAGRWRGIGDDAAYRAVIHAYNEFLVEEYCAVAPDRLMAMGTIPVTNVEDALEEMEYCARSGLKGVALMTFPSGKGYPSSEDDRFWAAALDLNMPLTVHGSLKRQGPSFKYERTPWAGGVTSKGSADPVPSLARFGNDSCVNGIQLALAGVFDRFPKLRLYFAETMVGWIPYTLEQVDDNWRRNRHWMARDYGVKAPARPLSEYIREHCWWSFLYDPFGVRVRHEAGIGRIMWASDFPHSASDWPHSREFIDEMFVGVPEEERYQILVGNAVDYFHLES